MHARLAQAIADALPDPAAGGWLTDALVYAPLALLLAGVAAYVRHVWRERAGSREDTSALEAEFEARVLAELLGADPPGAAAPPARAGDGAPSAAISAPAPLAPRPDGRADEDAPLPTAGGPPFPSAPAASGGPAVAPPDLAEVVHQLRRLRADLAEQGRVANLGGAPGVGLAVSWDKGRHQAVLVHELPPAFALPNLLRRFDAVIVAPPSSATEPIVIDRASAFFLRDVKVT